MRPRAAALLLALACAAPESGPPDAPDDPGAPLVENDPADAARWTTGASPILDIGGSTGAAGHELFDVAGARRLPSGDLAVADRGASEIRIFDAAGRLTRTLGGEGEGPGEFAGLESIQLRGDSIVAVDGRSLRITVFAPDGTVARETPTKSPWIGMLGDGSPVSIAYRFPDPPPQGLYRDRAALVLHDPRTYAVVDTVATVDLFGVFATPETGRWPPLFGLTTDWGFLGDAIVIADDGRTSIEIIGRTGEPRLRIGRHYRRSPVRDADVEALIEWRLARETSTARIERFEAAYRSLPVPETMPAFGRTDPMVPEPPAVVTAGGRIWIKDYDPPPLDPPRWSVFTEEGDLLAIAELPAGFQLLDATADAVVGLWRDPFDVEHVRIYRLRM